MSKSFPIVVALVLVVALLGTGCGDSDESEGTSASSATSQSLSKEEFIRQAETICRETDDRKGREALRYTVDHKKELAALSPVAAEEQILRAVVLPAIVEQARKIEALGAPEGEEAKVKELLAAVDLGMTKARKNPYAIELEVPSEYPFIKYANLARAYGFSECRNLA